MSIRSTSLLTRAVFAALAVLGSRAWADEETVLVLDPFTVVSPQLPSVSVTFGGGMTEVSLMNTNSTTGAGSGFAGTLPVVSGDPCFQTRKVRNFYESGDGSKGIIYEVALPKNGTGLYVQVIQITKNYINGESVTAHFTEALRVANGKVFSATHGSTPTPGSYANSETFQDVNRANTPSIDTSPIEGAPIGSVTMHIISSFIPGDSSAPAGFTRFDDDPNIVGNNGLVVDYGKDLYAKSGADLDLVYRGNQITNRGLTVTNDSTEPKGDFLNAFPCR